MNINIQLSKDLQERIQEEANNQLRPIIENILKDDKELNDLLHKTIQGQVKNIALQILQGQDLRSMMAQKVYPIVYQTLGLTQPKAKVDEDACK